MLIRDCRVEGYKDSQQLHRSGNRLHKQVSAGAPKFCPPLLKIETKVSQTLAPSKTVKCGPEDVADVYELKGG